MLILPKILLYIFRLIMVNMALATTFFEEDLAVFRLLYERIANIRKNDSLVISLLGSSYAQRQHVQTLVINYLMHLKPYAKEIVFVIGGRGEKDSIMDACIDVSFNLDALVLIVGIEPVFDLGGKVLEDNIFRFKSLLLRHYAVTQFSDCIIAFPGGMGTVQEIIAPIMYKKLDKSFPVLLKGPDVILIPEEEKSPVTDFIETFDGNKDFIPDSLSSQFIRVNLDSFIDIFTKFRRELPIKKSE